MGIQRDSIRRRPGADDDTQSHAVPGTADIIDALRQAGGDWTRHFREERGRHVYVPPGGGPFVIINDDKYLTILRALGAVRNPITDLWVFEMPVEAQKAMEFKNVKAR